jgi:Ca2+-binding RTX toxin-like protein
MALINGTTGSNSLTGTSGRDTILGLEGNDTINGGRGNDSVNGGPGADVLIWDQDSLSSGSVDTYVGGSTVENYNSDIYGTLSGGDRLQLNGAGGMRVTFSTSENGYALDAYGNRLNFTGIERLQTGSGNDSIDGSKATLNAARGSGSSYVPVHGLTVNSGAGNDTIRGTSGSDVIDPGAGNDRVYGGGGTDLLMPSQGNDYGDAGAGDDNVRWGNNGSMSAITNIGNDTLLGGSGHDLLNLWAKGDGENSVGVSVTFTSNSAGTASYPQANGTLVFSQFEQFWTHEGRDTVNASGATIGSDRQGILINTRWGDDQITGSSGNDTIEGGEGADTINAGRGNDFISLYEDIYAADGANVARDADSDVLVLRDGFGTDTVRAFQAGDVRDSSGSISRHSDKLNVSGLHDAAGNLVDVGDVRVTSQGSSAVLSFPNGEKLILEGVSSSTLTSAMLVKLGIPAASSSQSSQAASATVTTTVSAEARTTTESSTTESSSADATVSDSSATATAATTSTTTSAAASGSGVQTGSVAHAEADHFVWQFPSHVLATAEHAGQVGTDVSSLLDSYRALVVQGVDIDHVGMQHLLGHSFDWN